MPAGGCRQPATADSSRMGSIISKWLETKSLNMLSGEWKPLAKNVWRLRSSHEKEIAWLIPHQANMRIIDAMAKRFEHLPAERIFKTVHKYGNTSASSVGIALDELLKAQTVKTGEKIF